MQQRSLLALSLLTPLAFAGRGWAATGTGAGSVPAPDGRAHAFTFGRRDRYWNIGPQRRSFCPGPWLRAGDNELLMLDLQRFSPAVVTAAEDLDGMRPAPIASRAGSYREGEGLAPIASKAGSYRATGNGWEPTLLAMAGRDKAHPKEATE
jgi:hypothetical protein